MSLFQTIGVPTTSNFLIQILNRPSLRTMPAGLTGAWECAPADHDDRSGLAKLWLRHQPGSALSRWFQERVRTDRGRLRRKSASGPTAVIARYPAILLVITFSITCELITLCSVGTIGDDPLQNLCEPSLFWIARGSAIILARDTGNRHLAGCHPDAQTLRRQGRGTKRPARRRSHNGRRSRRRRDVAPDRRCRSTGGQGPRCRSTQNQRSCARSRRRPRIDHRKAATGKPADIAQWYSRTSGASTRQIASLTRKAEKMLELRAEIIAGLV
jgi:hypothetical protein